jgi:hypothetical protein
MHAPVAGRMAFVTAGRRARKANLFIICGFPCMVKPDSLPIQDEPEGWL